MDDQQEIWSVGPDGDQVLSAEVSGACSHAETNFEDAPLRGPILSALRSMPGNDGPPYFRYPVPASPCRTLRIFPSLPKLTTSTCARLRQLAAAVPFLPSLLPWRHLPFLHVARLRSEALPPPWGSWTGAKPAHSLQLLCLSPFPSDPWLLQMGPRVSSPLLFPTHPPTYCPPFLSIPLLPVPPPRFGAPLFSAPAHRA